MQFSDKFIKNFEASLEAKGMLKATVQSYTSDVNLYKEWNERSAGNENFGDKLNVLSYIKHLHQEKGDSTNSVRRKIIALRQFFRHWYPEEKKVGSPIDEIPVPPRDESLPDMLSPEDIQVMMNALTEHNFKCLRDKAILSLLAIEGLKVREIMDLTWKDFLKQKDESSLKIIGPKARVITLFTDTTKAICNYKFFIEEELALDTPPHLFVSIKGRAGKPGNTRISRHGVKFMLYELAAKTGLKNINTELLRHCAISFQLDLKKDPELVKQHFGLNQLGNIAKHAKTAEAAKNTEITTPITIQKFDGDSVKMRSEDANEQN